MAKDFRTTETDSLYNDIEKMSTLEILNNINNEDQKVAIAVQKSIHSIESLVNAAADKLINGGRLFSQNRRIQVDRRNFGENGCGDRAKAFFAVVYEDGGDGETGFG